MPRQKSESAVEAALVPDLVGTDEALVRSWFDGYGVDDSNDARSSSAYGSASASASEWLSSVLARPPRPGRLGVGAEPPKNQVPEEAVPLKRAARRILGRKQRREAEEELEARSWAAGRSAKQVKDGIGAAAGIRTQGRGISGDGRALTTDGKSDENGNTSSEDSEDGRTAVTANVSSTACPGRQIRASGSSLDAALAEATSSQAKAAEASARRAEARRRRKKRKREASAQQKIA